MLFMHFDAILICFSVSAESNLASVIANHVPAAKKYHPKALVYLVGLKTDLRASSGNGWSEDHYMQGEGDWCHGLDFSTGYDESTTSTTITPVGCASFLSEVDPNARGFSLTHHVTTAQGHRLASHLGCVGYLECSARDNFSVSSSYTPSNLRGVDDVFTTPARAVLSARVAACRRRIERSGVRTMRPTTIHLGSSITAD